MVGTKTPQRPTQDDKLNPGNQEYEKNFQDFDFENHPFLSQPSPDEEANVKRAQNQENSPQSDTAKNAAQSEQAAADNADNNNKQVNTAPVDESETNAQSAAIPTNLGKDKSKKAKVSGRSKIVQRALLGGGGLFGIALVVSSFFVGQMLNFTKAAFKDSNTSKRQSAQLSTRQQKLQKRIFTVKDCKFAAILCKMSRGISPKEIAAYQEKGLLPTDPEKLKEYLKIDNKGRAAVLKLDKPDGKGGVIQVTEANFAEHLLDPANPGWAADATGGFSKYSAWRARAPTTLKLLVERWKINLRWVLGKDTSDPKVLKEEFYKKTYGLNTDDPITKGVDDATKEEAKTQAAKAIQEGVVPGFPDATALDNISAVDALNKVSASGFLNRLGNILGTGCGVAQEFRTAKFVAWGLKHKNLIAFALMIFNELDAIKAGNGNASQLGFIMGTLLLTFNKNGEGFAHSNFVQHYILGQPINVDGDLKKMSLTEPGSESAIWSTVSAFLAPMNKTTCNNAVQYIVIGAQIAGLIFSGGLSAGAKAVEIAKLAATAGALSFTIAMLDLIIQPLLIRALVGAAPSLAEGGKIMGEGLFVGAAALTETVGWTLGLHPNSQALAYESMLAAQPSMESMIAAEHKHTSPFNINQADSITSQLAWRTLPYLTSPLSSGTLQNLASMVVSPFNLVAGSASSLLMHRTHADGFVATKDNCAHENYTQMNIATTDCSNIDMGLTVQEQNMNPDEAAQYLIDHGQLDSNTGKAKEGSNLKKYQDICMKEPTYLVPDHGGPDFNDGIDTSICTNNDDELAHIHVWNVDGALYESAKHEDDNTLGTTATTELYD